MRICSMDEFTGRVFSRFVTVDLAGHIQFWSVRIFLFVTTDKFINYSLFWTLFAWYRFYHLSTIHALCSTFLCTHLYFSIAIHPRCLTLRRAPAVTWLPSFFLLYYVFT